MGELVFYGVAAAVTAVLIGHTLTEWIKGERPPRALVETLALLTSEWKLISYEKQNDPMWDAILEARGRRFVIGQEEKGGFFVWEQVPGCTPTFEQDIIAATPSQIAATLNVALKRFDDA